MPTRATRQKRKGFQYNPSKVGEYPHKDTGRLRASAEAVEVPASAGQEFTIRVGSDLKYARILEVQRGRLLFKATATSEASELSRILSTPTGAAP